jgi:hypothetical protein
MKKVLCMAAVALMFAGSSAFAHGQCSGEKKEGCSKEKSECSAEKSACSKDKTACTKDQ